MEIGKLQDEESTITTEELKRRIKSGIFWISFYAENVGEPFYPPFGKGDLVEAKTKVSPAEYKAMSPLKEAALLAVDLSKITGEILKESFGVTASDGILRNAERMLEFLLDRKKFCLKPDQNTWDSRLKGYYYAEESKLTQDKWRLGN